VKKCLLHFGLIALVLSAVLSGCKKADTTAAVADPNLTFALLPDNPQATFIVAVIGKQAFVWTAGTANITRFKLNALKGGVASEYSSGTLTNVDLFNLSTLVSTISIPKADYTAVKLGIVFSQTTSTAYPIQLLGTYTTASGTTVPVEFDLNDNVEIDVSVANIIADGTKDFTTNVAMHLNMFLNSIAASDIDAAARTNGTILISKTVNVTLYNKIKANMLICAASTLASVIKH
jgi:hypothetical protein